MHEKAQVMTGLLEGKISLVTGASSDIGRATALVLAREGATIVVSDTDADGAEQVLDSVKKIGADGIAVHSNLSDSDGARALVDRVVATYGRLDCACNHPGNTGYPGGRLHDCPEDAWEKLIDVDLKSIWLSLKYETAQMLRQGSGAVVNVAAVFCPIGSSRTAVCAARAQAIVGLSKSAALEYALKGLRFNAVCPGVNNAPGVWERAGNQDADENTATCAPEPLGRLGSPTKIAEAVAWLCSDAASLITGLAMTIDGHSTTTTT